METWALSETSVAETVSGYRSVKYTSVVTYTTQWFQVITSSLHRPGELFETLPNNLKSLNALNYFFLNTNIIK